MTAPAGIAPCQLSRGVVVDLARLDLARIDVAVQIAAPLAAIVRFAGHTGTGAPAHGYSVAQHCVLGADALLEETGCPTTALAYLVHDAHAALIGDQTTPFLALLGACTDAVLRTTLGREAPERIRAERGRGTAEMAMEMAKGMVDLEIHRLAGLPGPGLLPKTIRDTIRAMDLRMLDAERRLLLGPTRERDPREVWPGSVVDARPVRLRGGLVPWPARRAAREWMHRWELWRIRRTP